MPCLYAGYTKTVPSKSSTKTREDRSGVVPFFHDTCQEISLMTKHAELETLKQFKLFNWCWSFYFTC